MTPEVNVTPKGQCMLLYWRRAWRATDCMQVELPLGATEDRICGTIDIEKALMEGVKAYEPGLLVSVQARAVPA